MTILVRHMNLELSNQSMLYQSQRILSQYSPTSAWPEKNILATPLVLLRWLKQVITMC